MNFSVKKKNYNLKTPIKNKDLINTNNKLNSSKKKIVIKNKNVQNKNSSALCLPIKKNNKNVQNKKNLK